MTVTGGQEVQLLPDKQAASTTYEVAVSIGCQTSVVVLGQWKSAVPFLGDTCTGVPHGVGASEVVGTICSSCGVSTIASPPANQTLAEAPAGNASGIV